MLSLLMVISDKKVMIVRMFFMIGKQIAFVAKNNDFLPFRRGFIQSVSKCVSKYLWSMYQERIADK